MNRDDARACLNAGLTYGELKSFVTRAQATPQTGMSRLNPSLTRTQALDILAKGGVFAKADEEVVDRSSDRARLYAMNILRECC